MGATSFIDLLITSLFNLRLTRIVFSYFPENLGFEPQMKVDYMKGCFVKTK